MTVVSDHDSFSVEYVINYNQSVCSSFEVRVPCFDSCLNKERRLAPTSTGSWGTFSDIYLVQDM